VARATRADQVRVECALDAVGMGALDRARAAIEHLGRRCAEQGIALVASPLRAGARSFDAVVLPGRAPVR
jgi:hypothetical protein